MQSLWDWRRNVAEMRRSQTAALTENKIMKTKNLFLLPALIAVLNLLPAGRVTAQTFTTLHSFTALPSYTNTDGANPNGFVQSGDTLYRTAIYGGSSQRGTGFK